MYDWIDSTVGGATVPVLWVYDEMDPFAITLVFHDGNDTTWVFSRDVLFCALNDRFGGDGDVVWMVEDHIARLSVSSPEGAAEVLFNRDQVQDFFDKTLDTVPLGCETLDVDKALTQIFSESNNGEAI